MCVCARIIKNVHTRVPRGLPAHTHTRAHTQHMAHTHAHILLTRSRTTWRMSAARSFYAAHKAAKLFALARES